MPDTLDILAALEADPSRGDGKCGVAQFLASIPEDAPGRDELIRLVETPHARGRDTRSGQSMAMALTRLGYKVTTNPVLDHRKRVCACYR